MTATRHIATLYEMQRAYHGKLRATLMACELLVAQVETALKDGTVALSARRGLERRIREYKEAAGK